MREKLIRRRQSVVMKKRIEGVRDKKHHDQNQETAVQLAERLAAEEALEPKVPHDENEGETAERRTVREEREAEEAAAEAATAQVWSVGASR